MRAKERGMTAIQRAEGKAEESEGKRDKKRRRRGAGEDGIVQQSREGKGDGEEGREGRGRTGEGRSKRRKGRKERRLGWLGIARWYRGNSEGEETKQEGGRREGWEKKRYTGAERRKRSISCPSPSVVLLLARLFLCFPLLPVRDIPGLEEMRRGEECRDREGERRRFFFVLLDESGAGQARGGRTNRKPA